MARIILVLLLIILHLTACQMKETTLPSALEFTQELTNTSTRAAATATFVTSPTSTIFFPTASTPPTSTHISTPTELPTDTPTKTPSFTIHPVIHEQPGELYETVFSIPVGSGNIIQYSGGCCTTLIGPNALAVLPDLSFLIADYLGTRIRILHYDHNGRLLNTLYMDDLGIKMIRDLRTRGNQVFLLETSYENYWVHQISLDGELFASQKIPHLYQVGGKDYTLESILTGIAIDCEENILLEAGGDQYRLTDIQTQSNLENVTKGYFCNGKRYQVINPGPGKTPNIIAGDIIYETQTTMGLGGFSIMEVFQDGRIYADRDDVVNFSVIQVDQTVHYIGPNGDVQGSARVPLSEFRYPPDRNKAIGPDGEVYVLLPRPDSIDIVRLKFYTQLEPLKPGAEIPHIYRK